MENVSKCLLSISDEEGVLSIVSTLLKRSAGGNVVASTTLKEFILNTKSDLGGVSELLVQGLLPLYGSSNERIVANSVEALNALVKDFSTDQMLELVMPLKRVAGQLYSANEDKKAGTVGTVAALCRQDGWKALLAILREGLLSGEMDAKELAGLAMTMLISVSGEAGLKPYAVNMAGPFIRVLGDRQSPPHVKIAVLGALLKLLDKVRLRLW